MIELYQELIPFSNNKNPNAVSQNGTLSNPILLSTSLDITSMYTTVEGVIYIRNNDPTKYYKNVLVCLMAPSRFLDISRMKDQYGHQCKNDQFNIKNIYFDSSVSTLNIIDTSDINRVNLKAEYCSEMLPTDREIVFDKSLWFDGRTNSSYLPASYEIISSGVAKNALLSYGYDEISVTKWKDKSSIIIIPSIGTSTTPDTSYIPIRIRIDIQQNSTMLSSLTDYSLNVMYENEYYIGNI
jgi:hypothetical protein